MIALLYHEASFRHKFLHTTSCSFKLSTRKMPPEGEQKETQIDRILETTKMTQVNNFINGNTMPPSTLSYMSVESPSTSSQIATVALSSQADVDSAVEAAQEAFESWSALTMKSRAVIMLKFHNLVRENAQELAELIVKENGKNITEGA